MHAHDLTRNRQVSDRCGNIVSHHPCSLACPQHSMHVTVCQTNLTTSTPVACIIPSTACNPSTSDLILPYHCVQCVGQGSVRLGWVARGACISAGLLVLQFEVHAGGVEIWMQCRHNDVDVNSVEDVNTACTSAPVSLSCILRATATTRSTTTLGSNNNNHKDRGWSHFGPVQAMQCCNCMSCQDVWDESSAGVLVLCLATQVNIWSPISSICDTVSWRPLCRVQCVLGTVPHG
jgi:hypothetical protein